MTSLHRKRKIAAIAVFISKELLSKVNLLPPFLDDDDTDEDEEIVVIPSKRVKPLRIENYVDRLIPEMSERQFQSHFRVNRRTYDLLLPIIHNEIKKQCVIGRNKMSTEKQLLATLWILGTPDSYRSVGERFEMGKSSLSAAFFRVVQAINTLSPAIIKWPTGENLDLVKQQFHAISGVDNVIGAVDGTFISIKAPKVDPEVYVTRKCNYAITLQAICDAPLKLTDCFVGYPGSLAIREYLGIPIYNQVLYFPQNEFIVGDKAYPLLDWCIPPYIDRGNLNAQKRHFNFRISQTRQVIERAFALLFGRFRRLKYLDMNRVDFIPATVLASCVLHNLCLNNNDLNVAEYFLEGERHVLGNDDIAPGRGVLNMDDSIRAGHAKREELCRTLFYVEQ